MSIIDQLLAAGIPIIVDKCDEEAGRYAFRETTPEQIAIFRDIVAPPTYDILRAREYPPLSQLADALYWMERKDKTLMEAWLKKCDAVKIKYPKP